MSASVRHGFVLLEAVVALLIVGLCAAAALELFASHLRAADRGPARLTAAALAEDRLAAVRLLEPVQLQRLPRSLAQGRFAPPLEQYRWRATVTPASERDLYDLRVEIAWPHGVFTLATREVVPSPPNRGGLGP